MNDSRIDLSYITASNINDESGIKAYFTQKNQSIQTKDATIEGLNLGYNTSEKKKVVDRNRKLLFSKLNINPRWVAFGRQVHSNNVQVVTQGGTYPRTDGLITQVPGLTLAIQVADCAAVLLWDENRKIIGALHAGWRGAVGEIIYIGIEKMMKQGANPSDMKAFISPCISMRNFEVGHEVADQFPPEFVDYSTFKKPHVDLKGFIKDQLMNKGLSEHNIEVRSECSVSNESFYSYRREGEKSGRMMALIQISDE